MPLGKSLIRTFARKFIDLKFRWKYYIVFVIILIILIVTVWIFYPETKGYTLEEMATIFDGGDAAALAQWEILDRIAKKKGTDAEVAHLETA